MPVSVVKNIEGFQTFLDGVQAGGASLHVAVCAAAEVTINKDSDIPNVTALIGPGTLQLLVKGDDRFQTIFLGRPEVFDSVAPSDTVIRGNFTKNISGAFSKVFIGKKTGFTSVSIMFYDEKGHPYGVFTGEPVELGGGEFAFDK